MSTKLNGITSDKVSNILSTCLPNWTASPRKTVISVYIIFRTPDHVTSSVIEPVLPDRTCHSISRRGTAVTSYEVYKCQKCRTHICYDGLQQWRTQEFCSWGGGFPTNSVEDRGQREWGSGGCSPLVRGSGGSCNLVQEISFHMVKFS